MNGLGLGLGLGYHTTPASRRQVSIRFQADADFNEKIIAAVRRREPAVDFRTAVEAGFG